MYRPGSSLSKAKTSKASAAQAGGMAVKPVEHKMPTLEEYIKNRDWVGAIAWLENEKRYFFSSINSFLDNKVESKLWLAYAYFHNGDYKLHFFCYIIQKSYTDL